MQRKFFTRFTTKAKKSLLDAQQLADDLGASKIGSEHILYGIAAQQGSIGGEILQYVGLAPKGIRAELAKLSAQKAALSTKGTAGQKKSSRSTSTKKHPKSDPSIDFSEHTKQILEKSFLIAFRQKHSYVGTEHLLAGIMRIPGSRALDLIRAMGVSYESIEKHIEVVLHSTSKFHKLEKANEELQEEIHEQHAQGDHDAEHPQPREYRLEDLGVDLSQKSVESRLDPVVGRAEEINRIISILNRRTKNNPLLVGEPGVGKTAIVEGLAKKIASGDVPNALLGMRIFELDLASLVAGTMYRGEFEERVKKVLEEVKKDKRIILFIDEIHNIVGTGSVPGSLDAANIIKPALARGDIRCIGATTFKEYKQFIEKDAALDRRFQRVVIDEPSIADALKVLSGLRSTYERYHRIRITDEAIKAAVELSSRYLPDRFLPDKALDLLDEASANLRTSLGTTRSQKILKKLQTDLIQLEKMKYEAVQKEQFAHAQLYKQREETLRKKIGRLTKTDEKKSTVLIGEIGEMEIAQLISRMTGIPVSRLSSLEKQKIFSLKTDLGSHIIGQDHALDAIVSVIKRHRAGISDPARPIGSFLFLGPTGVGKTELAKTIARVVFEDPKALIRVDMSEFRERFNVSKLIGAPAGYVGYEEGGTLTEKVRKKPYSVILFDEIEKAHPDVLNILLQILDDGMLTDASGRTINFKNTIIVMTSNIGSQEFSTKASLGFHITSSEQRKQFEREYKKLQQEVLENVRKSFVPEFLGRIDRMIVFHPLTLEHAQTIALLQLKQLQDRMKKRGIAVHIDPKAQKLVVQKGFKKDQGVRLMKKIIQQHIEEALADALLAGEKSSVTITTLDNKIVAK